jgi:hypothetical protein
MSSTTITQASLFGADDAIGVVRQRTQVKVIVHSHILRNPPTYKPGKPGVVDCSEDTISLTTSKNLKGIGNATVTLVPRENYINYIFPNDWINIWVNPGDGRGFIRVFFGFVDRVERSINVDDNGSTNTRFTLSCSDFTKAFEMTHVYFNPYISEREDFVGNFAGTKNLAGAQLRTKGITAFGTPADIVLSYAHLLMGFGSQFVAPKEYPFNQALLEESRRFRRDWAKSRLSKNILAEIGQDTIKEWVDKLTAEAEIMADSMQSGEFASEFGDTDEEKLKDKLDVALQNAEKRGLLSGLDSEVGRANAIKQFAIGLLLEEKNLPKDLLNDPDIKSGLAVEETAAGPGHLLDLIDFSLVEHAAIDGSIVSAPIWTQQGSLWSLMNSYSNNMVNELFMDLRPLSAAYEEKALYEGGYYIGPDEHELEDFGVRFVPSLIMREYPFSTITDVEPESKILVQGKPLKGKIEFGPIFSKEPNIPGRKTVQTRVLNDFLYMKDPTGRATKHIDVAVISILDITSENVGRSDADVVNLIEVYSDGVFGKHMKFIMQDIQPVATPISVARHGLRVRTYTTKFARFSKKYHSEQGVDTLGTRRKLIRWALMLDHWYQHNIEYLNGTISTRAFPEIRVGFRLDVAERNESYYVEGVNHSWNYPNPMVTTFTLSRGQRNDPFPVYEKPAISAFGGLRKEASRLADMFNQKDPSAVRRSLSTQGKVSDPNDANFLDFGVRGSWSDTKSYVDAVSGEALVYEEALKALESVGELFDPNTRTIILQDSLGPASEALIDYRVQDRAAQLKSQTGASSLSGSSGRGVKK